MIGILILTSLYATELVHAQQYPHGIGSNSSALSNTVGLTYQQCQDKISNEMQKTVNSLDRGKAISLALASPDFQAEVSGHPYELTIISTNDTWDNSLCSNVKRTAVGVGFNLLDTPDTYLESVNVAEDADITQVIEVSTTKTPICHNNCPLASPPAAWNSFIPNIDSDFFLNGRMIPNATLPVGVDLVNTGNFTLYDVQVAFVDSPLLQNFKTSYGNFTLKVGEEKTVLGSMSLPSRISNVTSTLNWMIYVKNQDGMIGSKEFQRTINLANVSSPEYSQGYDKILPPLKQVGTVNDIQCKEGFQLIVKVEDYAPACVTSTTFQKLIVRGWGESLEGLLATPLEMEITRLNQTYVAGHTVSAIVKYTGYEHGGVYPDMKILDVNGTQVWSNCCIIHTETPSMHFGTFTYDVEGPLGYPVINKTGTYTMIASLDNVTATAIFNVIPSNMMQTSVMKNIKNYDPFGITALIIYHPPDLCLNPTSHSIPAGMPSCPPNNFYLKINSNSTAYLLGYDICDGNSCATNNTLSLLLPLNTGLHPDYQMIGLPVDLQWKMGDMVNIQITASHDADNKTTSQIDLGSSTIVP
jgi:hypothetical protein